MRMARCMHGGHRRGRERIRLEITVHEPHIGGRMKNHSWLVAAATLAFMVPAFAAEPHDAALMIRHATVVDVEHARAIPDQAVVVRGNDIVAVGNDAAIAPAWRAGKTIDAAGRYLIPGLWDMHVHFGGPGLVPENEALLPLYVANGITTIRDCSDDIPDAVLAWRKPIAEGSLPGPQLFSSGAKLEGIDPVWTRTLEVGSKADVDAELARLRQDHVDFVKITDSTIKPDVFLYAVARAKDMGLRTSAHIPLGVTIEQAVDAGLTSIEHIDYAYKLGAKDEAAIVADYNAGRITAATARERLQRDFDPATAMRGYRKLAAKGVFVTPTLYESGVFAHLDSNDHAHDANLAYIGPGLRETWNWRVARAGMADASQVAARHASLERITAILPMLQKAGVKILAGTDAGYLNSFIYPGFSLHDEMDTYVKAGLAPSQVLASATRSGPSYFGKLDRYGGIAPGKAADMVLLDRNPLKDIDATRAIDTVVMRGRVYDRAALDGMLKTARDKVTTWNADVAGKAANISLWSVEGKASAIGLAEKYAEDARAQKSH